MKITDVKVISFKAKSRSSKTKWGYEVWGEEHDEVRQATRLRLLVSEPDRVRRISSYAGRSELLDKQQDESGNESD